MKTLLQLYSARNYQPWEGVLAQTAATGFTGVEPFAAVFDHATAFRALADRNALALPAAHVPLKLLEEQPEQAFDVCHTLGVELIVVPWLPEEARPTTRAAADDLGRRLAVLQRRAAASGFRLAYHNHDFEFITLEDGSLLMEVLLGAEPAILWEADIGWLIRAGQDPLAWLDRYSDRVVSVHLKDYVGGESEGGWADLGYGPTDYRPIFSKLTRLPKLDYCVAEHDDPADFNRFVRRWMESFRRLSQAAGLI